MNPLRAETCLFIAWIIYVHDLVFAHFLLGYYLLFQYHLSIIGNCKRNILFVKLLGSTKDHLMIDDYAQKSVSKSNRYAINYPYSNFVLLNKPIQNIIVVTGLIKVGPTRTNLNFWSRLTKQYLLFFIRS
jgi:hypothetical protein